MLMELEDRSVPTTFTWLGANGGDWSVGTNWNQGTAPTAGAAAKTSGPEGADGFLKSVIASLQDYLKDIAGPVNGLMLEAVQAIANALPELVKQILGALRKRVQQRTIEVGIEHGGVNIALAADRWCVA